ncbi:MAG: HlyC/CorC family transporter [Candidatus Improbicoccus pseudotrichonymphae]|uniref:HlyC/CorC family transporter n=1 Tax=Candidatus Improbicoccus pseudotrichonymphae TaxID=3033792 RepID=A0AA48KYK5_9FIRM|nr:MAG: HlyC/CorC family transporter [Candidatus Improbicoccus pseudotrichonymphae]
MKEIFILVGFILLNAFFALAEIAVITLNDKKIKSMSLKGHKSAKKVMSLIGNSSNFLATIQVGVTLSSFLTSASAAQNFSEPLSNSLGFLNLSKNVSTIVATVFLTIIMSYFSLVFGELIPKKIAMQNAEEISFKIVGLLLFFSKAFSPFIWFLTFSCNTVLRCFGVDPNQNEQSVTEEEILMMVDAGEEKGLIEDKAKNMIVNVFDFDNTTVNEIMTHRTDIVAVDSSSKIQDVVKISIKRGFSRIPVFEKNIDKISGIIYIKDLLKFVDNEIPKNFNFLDIVRSVTFVPSTKKCNELFTEFTSNRIQIAIVVDEYGGTEGIVTMEDLVESIVGNIQDEYDAEENEIKKISEDTFVVDGSLAIDEFEKYTNVKIPSGEYDTIAGFLTEKLGKIPKINERSMVKTENGYFTVLEANDRRIIKANFIKRQINP